MAKKPNKPIELTFQDIVLNANAEIIRQALEAREKIDVLLVEREAAYRRIAELEAEVEQVIGEESVFPFPAPAMPVAGYDKSMPATLVKSAKPENLWKKMNRKLMLICQKLKLRWTKMRRLTNRLKLILSLKICRNITKKATNLKIDQTTTLKRSGDGKSRHISTTQKIART